MRFPDIIKKAKFVGTADVTVVSAVPNRYICVNFIHLHVDTGSATIYWRSNTTAISEAEVYAPGEGYHGGLPPINGDCMILWTDAGESLILDITGTTNVAGWITYYIRDRIE